MDAAFYKSPLIVRTYCLVLVILFVYYHLKFRAVQVSAVPRAEIDRVHTEQPLDKFNFVDGHDIRNFPLLVLISIDTERFYEFFERSFDRLGIPHTRDPYANWTMCWGSQNFPPKRFPWQRINRILGFQATCSKRKFCDSMWNTAKLLSPVHLDDALINNEISPPCFLLPDHVDALMAYNRELSAQTTGRTGVPTGALMSLKNRTSILKSPPRWVLKLDYTSSGSGIYLASDISDITNTLSACDTGSQSTLCKYSKNDGIVQQFVTRPLLIDGKRISFRLFALVDSLKPMRVFISYVGFTLLASANEPADNFKGTGSFGRASNDASSGQEFNSSSLCAWITNYSFQRARCPAYLEYPEMLPSEYFRGNFSFGLLLNDSAHVWSSLSIFEYINTHYPNINSTSLWSNIRRAVGSALIRTYPASRWQDKFIPRSDQLILGIDMAFQENGNVQILEINCHPDWEANFLKSHVMVDLLVRGVVSLTGSLMYRYPKHDAENAAMIVDEFCNRVRNCTSDSWRALRDTELMLRKRSVFDIAVPSFEVGHLYKSLLHGQDFHEDRLLLSFVTERIQRLKIRDGDIRFLNPTVQFLSTFDNDDYYYNSDLLV